MESSIDENLHSNISDEMTANYKSVNNHQSSEAEELFISEYADIQYEDITSIVETLEHLNLEHINLES